MSEQKTIHLVITLEAEFQLGELEVNPDQRGVGTWTAITVLPNLTFEAIDLGVTPELLESRLKKLVQDYIAEELYIPASSLSFIRWAVGPAMVFFTTAPVTKGGENKSRA